MGSITPEPLSTPVIADTYPTDHECNPLAGRTCLRAGWSRFRHPRTARATVELARAPNLVGSFWRCPR
jgi:hypothetical protein